MRVVLDTNVLISALLFKQRLGVFEIFIKTGVLAPCFTVATFQELKNVLGYDHLQSYLQRSNLTAAEIIKNLTPHCQFFPDPDKIPKLATHASDDYILAAAATAKAEYLVTGDKGLLSVKMFENIPIIQPQKLLKIYAQEK